MKHKDPRPFDAWAGIKLSERKRPYHSVRVRVKSRGTPGEVPCAGGLCRPLFLEVIMDIEIKDTPYDDRSCGNCKHCVKTELRYCLKNHAFVAKNKWCTEWCAEERFNKFEN